MAKFLDKDDVTIYHVCNATSQTCFENGNIRVMRGGHRRCEWWLSINAEYCEGPITHCPFCGVNLEYALTTPENKAQKGQRWDQTYRVFRADTSGGYMLYIPEEADE